jgi:tetratricopeptide (TPR) repeat protein
MPAAERRPSVTPSPEQFKRPLRSVRAIFVGPWSMWPRVAIGCVVGVLACTRAEMSGAGPRQASEAVAASSCERPGAELEASWSPESKALASAAMQRLDGAWVEPLRARTFARLDQLGKELALMQAESCEALQRRQVTQQAYDAMRACSERSVIEQRAVVEALKHPAKEQLFRVDRALALVEEDRRVCRDEAAFAGYDAPAADAGARRARERQARARAYRVLGDARASETLESALAEAQSSSSARVKVGVWIDHSSNSDADLAAARREAREALNLAAADGYELGVVLAEAQLARLDEREKNYSAALEVYARVLERMRGLLGERHPYVVRIYARIGVSHSFSGDHARARAATLKALQIAREWFGEQHPETADAYRRLAIIDTLLGDPRSALAEHGRALDVWRALLGEQHPETAEAYGRVGAAHGRSQQHARAIGMVSHALAIQRDILGERHAETADSYFSLGVVHYAMQDYAQALPNYSRALEIRREVFGEKHWKVASGYCELGATYHGLKDYPRALDGYARALSIQQLLGEEVLAAARIRRAMKALCNDGYTPACT